MLVKSVAALRYRNYRLLWSGNAVSQFGDFMQQIAQNWLVWQITGSVTALGLAAFVAIVPRLLFGFLGGPLVDNHNRRRLLMYTQSTAFICALGFSVAVLTHFINLRLILFFIFALETTQTVNSTTRQALLPEIVPREHIPSAVSFNSVGNNSARIVGPAVGGILIPLTGVGGLMLINTITFLIVVVAVGLMEIPNQTVTAKVKHVNSFRADLIEGYHYIWRNTLLRTLLYLGMISSFLIMPFTNLLPAYVGTILVRGPQFLGFLTAAYGIGATVRSGIGNTVTILAAVVQGCAILFFGLSSSFLLCLVFMFILGLSTMIYNNSVVTALQLTTSQEYIGRVMGVYLMNKGVTATGAMLLGIVAGYIGVGRVFILSGALYLVFGAGVQFFNSHLMEQAISPAVPK